MGNVTPFQYMALFLIGAVFIFSSYFYDGNIDFSLMIVVSVGTLLTDFNKDKALFYGLIFVYILMIIYYFHDVRNIDLASVIMALLLLISCILARVDFMIRE